MNARMAFLGHGVAHFPARMQPKQCYDSLIPKRRASGPAREKSLP